MGLSLKSWLLEERLLVLILEQNWGGGGMVKILAGRDNRDIPDLHSWPDAEADELRNAQ